MNVNPKFIKSRRIEKDKLTESQKKGGITISISNNIEFQSKSITGYEEDNLIIIKGSLGPEDIILLNVHACNNRPSKYMKVKPVYCKKK